MENSRKYARDSIDENDPHKVDKMQNVEDNVPECLNEEEINSASAGIWTGKEYQDAEKLESEEGRNPEEDNVVQLSDSIFIHIDRKLTEHGNVFEGEIKSGVYGVRPCAIKFAQKSEYNIREARILTKLSSHTHVISIIQSGVHKDLFEEHVYIALDKCHKQNLRQYFEHRKENGVVYDVNVGLEYSKQIIAGMTYIHENLIFHKDLKPSNILLSSDRSTIKLADFGLSEELKSTSSKVFCKQQFGTNGFRPLESFGNSWASLKSDIYSLGVVLYFVLSNGMSPFGADSFLWTYNMKIGATDISHLLVSNPATTEHLIKLMMSQERCRRPSIWQVAEHPCWTDDEANCDFDYGYQEEKDDSEILISETPSQVSGDSPEKEMEGIMQFLKEARKMGFGRISRPNTSVIIFDEKTKHLRCFTPAQKSITQMHEYDAEMKRNYFSSVFLGHHIYVLMSNQSMYRLAYLDATATWEAMPDMIDDHGLCPPAVATSEAIIVAGSSGWVPSKSVTRYNCSLKTWEKLEERKFAATNSANVASQGHVYCLGGFEEGIATNRVERLVVGSLLWGEVAPMIQPRYEASAVECGGKIIVAGGNGDNQLLNSVEKYDPDLNQWTMLNSMSVDRSAPRFRCHLINNKVYAVGPSYKGIEKYDVEEDKWEVLQRRDVLELDVWESVTVNMEK